MSGLNPLSFNGWVQNVGQMAVVQTNEAGGVWGFVDAELQTILPQILSYSEGRIQRDLDLLASKTSNQYTLTAGTNLLSIPVGDFKTVDTLQGAMTYNGTVINSWPLTPVSKEYIQTVFNSQQTTGQPRVYAMVGDNFGDGANTYNNVLFGPYANSNYTVIVNGTIWTPSLYTYATAGAADTSYTYISTYYPDLLMMASLIYISAFQRNFSATSDSADMGQSYEKQYQALRLGAVAEENRKKQQASGWTTYSTPVSATPTR
jgi:hypothetical protein